MEPENTALEQLQKSLQTFGSLAMAAESRDKLYRYHDALMQSLYSILDDQESDESTKLQVLDKSLDQYAAAMRELFPKLLNVQNPTGRPLTAKSVAKSETNLIEIEILDEVGKFNPYHDDKGRFASANGYASFTIRTKDPKKQHLADAAIAREKERAKQGLVPGGKTPEQKPDAPKKPKAPEKETKPSDPLNNPDSIGDAERGDPMDWKKADGNRPNPNYFLEPGYRINCQSCVVAFEARLRGYDVQTKANTRGSKLDELSRATNKAWIDPKTGKHPDYIRDESVTTAKKCRDWLEKTIEPGNRYTFQNSWKGRGRSGHIISADRDEDGNLRLYDPQCGKVMKGDDINAYLSRCKYTTSFYGHKVSVAPRVLRVDNMQLNPEFTDSIMEAKKAA